MLSIRRFCLFLIAAVALPAASLPTARPEDVGLSSERLARVHAMIQRYIDRQEIAGAVALVARRGRVADLKALGVMNLESRKPMQPDTIFRIASMTKPITTVAVMMLYEQGYFQLRDPVSKFIPEFKNPKVAVATRPDELASATFKTVPAEREITIRDLLTHTSGLANIYNGPTIDLYKKAVAERKAGDRIGDFVKRLAKLPLNFQPGTAWAYGPSTDVLGYLVEVISGVPLDRFFEERIFRPLGMTDTYFYPPPDREPRFATTYEPAPAGGKGLRVLIAGRTLGPRHYFSGGGGLASTAPDYFRFCQMLLNNGELDGRRLLSRKTIELMTTNAIGNLPLWDRLAGYRFGLGLRVRSDLGESAVPGSLGSYGWGGAYGTYFWVDPKEQMIGILMIQLRPYTQLNIRLDFQTLATQAIAD